jgi:hypothetical protein
MAKKSLKNHIASGALALQEIERLAKHIAQGLRGNKAINMLCICFGPGVFQPSLQGICFSMCTCCFCFAETLQRLTKDFCGY